MKKVRARPRPKNPHSGKIGDRARYKGNQSVEVEVEVEKNLSKEKRERGRQRKKGFTTVHHYVLRFRVDSLSPSALSVLRCLHPPFPIGSGPAPAPPRSRARKDSRSRSCEIRCDQASDCQWGAICDWLYGGYARVHEGAGAGAFSSLVDSGFGGGLAKMETKTEGGDWCVEGWDRCEEGWDWWVEGVKKKVGGERE